MSTAAGFDGPRVPRLFSALVDTRIAVRAPGKPVSTSTPRVTYALTV